MAEGYLGLGSNLGDKRTMIAKALDRLDSWPGIRVTRRSGFYRTPPWGDTNQDWFLNAAAAIETDLDPHEVLTACLTVERELGRVRERKWGPRAIDIDVLALGQAHVASPDLTLPHPYLLERAFVLVPLAEIAPDLIVDGTPVRNALARLDRSGIDRVD